MSSVDLGVFGRQRSLVDQQQLQQDFEFKKALALQAAQRTGLETQVLQQSLANGGITPDKLMGYQIQMQNHQDALANQKATRESTDQYRNEMIGLQKEKLTDKKDLKYKTDQNLLAGALEANQQQISKVDALLNPDGTLKPNVAANYGTIAGYQLPNVHQDTINASADLQNVNANSFIQALGAMKSQSATGASGLGALSEKEGDKVQAAASAAANTKQDAASAAKNFQAYKKSLLDANNRLTSGFNNIYSAQPSAPALPAIDPSAARAELERRALAKQAGGQ